MSDNERKGLRFEVTEDFYGWRWDLIGADGPVCRSVLHWPSEEEARSNIAASKGRMKAARFAKVITVNE